MSPYIHPDIIPIMQNTILFSYSMEAGTGAETV